MGKIVVSENVSLDGVIEDPTDADGLGRGNWFAMVSDKDREAWAGVELDEALGAAALLLGRRSHAWFVARGWQSRSGEWADRLRSLPKYVISSTGLDGPGWDNSTVLQGDLLSEVSRLRQEVDGEIVVYGSGRLVRTLLEHDLVDELRLMTYPVVVGAGERLFGETDLMRPLRLVDTRLVGDGLAFLAYQPARVISAPK